LKKKIPLESEKLISFRDAIKRTRSLMQDNRYDEALDQLEKIEFAWGEIAERYKEEDGFDNDAYEGFLYQVDVLRAVIYRKLDRYH
jgi:hypothetical protein